jgi:hypothetical protein
VLLQKKRKRKKFHLISGPNTSISAVRMVIGNDYINRSNQLGSYVSLFRAAKLTDIAVPAKSNIYVAGHVLLLLPSTCCTVS